MLLCNSFSVYSLRLNNVTTVKIQSDGGFTLISFIGFEKSSFQFPDKQRYALSRFKEELAIMYPIILPRGEMIVILCKPTTFRIYQCIQQNNCSMLIEMNIDYLQAQRSVICALF